MAAIGTALIGKILGHSEAEKAFRPWWDTLEDQLIYILVMVGLIVVPTAIIMGTPLDCNFCQLDHCGANNTNSKFDYKDPGFNAWWVKKLCTLNGSVEPFMLYFPYFLLLVALVLWCIERVFLRIFNAGLKLETFYKFLVKENVLGDDKIKPENILIPGEASQDCTDGGREAIELKQSFKGNNNYFLSYLIRTILEILVAGGLLVWISSKGLPVIKHQDTILCNVHDYWYECSGAPAQFYLYVLYITVVITALYLILNFYNFLWLVFPCFGNLSRLMRTYKSLMMEGASPNQTNEEVLGELYHVYYNNRDLRLLLDLLATSSGVAPAINIMTLFDKKFHAAMRPKIVQINLSTTLGIARIEFQEPKTGVRAALSRIPGVNLVYVAEICPPADTAVEGFEFKQKEGNGKTSMKGDCEEGVEMVKYGSRQSLTGCVQAAVFTGLKPDVKYTMKVSTVVNGRTISQVVEEVGAHHELTNVTEAELADQQERKSN